MRKVLIVSALPQETEYIDEYLKDKVAWSKLADGNYVNVAKNIQVYVKIVGVGKVNAAYGTADAINAFSPELIVNVGIAGGLADDLDRGDVAIGTDYIQVDMKTIYLENAPVIAPTPSNILDGILKVAKVSGVNYRAGRIATGDFVLYERRKRKSIKKEYNPIAFDMETAAIAQVATAKSIDFVGIRSFSDMANKKTLLALNKNAEIDATEKQLREDVFKTPVRLVIDYLDSSFEVVE